MILCAIIVNGGDLVSTWITKLEVHVEDVTHLVKNVTKHIIAKNTGKSVAFVNDRFIADDSIVAIAA